MKETIVLNIYLPNLKFRLIAHLYVRQIYILVINKSVIFTLVILWTTFSKIFSLNGVSTTAVLGGLFFEYWQNQQYFLAKGVS